MTVIEAKAPLKYPVRSNSPWYNENCYQIDEDWFVVNSLQSRLPIHAASKMFPSLDKVEKEE